jgi:hypothetical protein
MDLGPLFVVVYCIRVVDGSKESRSMRDWRERKEKVRMEKRPE